MPAESEAYCHIDCQMEARGQYISRHGISLAENKFAQLEKEASVLDFGMTMFNNVRGNIFTPQSDRRTLLDPLKEDRAKSAMHAFKDGR